MSIASNPNPVADPLVALHLPLSVLEQRLAALNDGSDTEGMWTSEDEAAVQTLLRAYPELVALAAQPLAPVAVEALPVPVNDPQPLPVAAEVVPTGTILPIAPTAPTMPPDAPKPPEVSADIDWGICPGCGRKLDGPNCPDCKAHVVELVQRQQTEWDHQGPSRDRDGN